MKFEEKFEEYINALRCEQEYMMPHLHRFKKIFNSIPHSSSPLRILDIGTTPFTFFIKENYPHYKVYTLDRRNDMEAQCKTRDIQFKICDLDKGSIPFDNDYFDLVIFTEVLEHIFAPPTEVLKEIRRIMRVCGGKLILSVPNIANLHNRIKLLFGITPLENPDTQMIQVDAHGAHGHIHEYTMKEITTLLKACNFKITSKEFLRLGVISVVKRSNKKGILPLLIRGGYHAVGPLVPSFRSTIYIECYKPDS